MREPPHNAVLLEPPTEKGVASLAWEEAIALIKFGQVEAGKRNFFVSPFLEVRERNLQGGLGNLASLKRKTLASQEAHQCSNRTVQGKDNSRPFCNAVWMPSGWLCPVTEAGALLPIFTKACALCEDALALFSLGWGTQQWESCSSRGLAWPAARSRRDRPASQQG